MLCSVVHFAPSLTLNTIIFIQFVIFLANYLKVRAALPPGAEDEIVLIEHLPGRRVHLQDFFWTDAEDAPPWLDPDQTLTLYETRTVEHTATVYVPVDGHDPGCISCIDPTPTLDDDDQDIGVLIGDDPGPRYWLLTVLRAGESVPPKVEVRLARLYRAAFARQQQRHLGLFSTDPRLRRATKRLAPANNHHPLPADSIDNALKSSSTPSPTNETKKIMREVKISREDAILKINLDLDSEKPTIASQSVITPGQGRADSGIGGERRFPRATPVSPVTESTPVTAATSVNSPKALRSSPGRFHPDFTSNTGGKRPVERDKDLKIEKNSSEMVSTALPRSSESQWVDFPPAKMAIVNHQSSATFRQSGLDVSPPNSTNSRLRTAGLGLVQVRMQNQTTLEDGATKLIYSVHLGGKPVPAETAAKDMALLSPQEVALELGAPVVIQSEPYLKESRPLALSRRRDAWLLIGAAGAAFILVTLIIIGVVITAKRKRAHSAVSAPPAQSILKKDRGYTPTTSGLDNTGYTSETEARTDGTSQRHTPGSLTRTPATPITPNSLDDEIQEQSSDDEDEDIKRQSQNTWDIEEYTASTKSRAERRRMTRMGAVDAPDSPDSMDTVVNHADDNERGHPIEETASPHSYLSMPPCKLFPSMRSVEPLSRILEPVVVKHLDMEFESPEMSRRSNGFVHRKSGDESLARSRSAVKDPGVVGPIVWDLRRQRAVEENVETSDVERQTLSGPVGRARRRLHELLEDSFSLFSTKDTKREVSSSLRPSSAAISPDPVTTFVESRGKSTHSSPGESPASRPTARPRTSAPRGLSDAILETGNAPPRGAWGSRPMSAGPFHRPNLPEVNVIRVLADSHLPAEDPAVPLIAAIKKELEKFTEKP